MEIIGTVILLVSLVFALVVFLIKRYPDTISNIFNKKEEEHIRKPFEEISAIVLEKRSMIEDRKNFHMLLKTPMEYNKRIIEGDKITLHIPLEYIEDTKTIFEPKKEIIKEEKPQEIITENPLLLEAQKISQELENKYFKKPLPPEEKPKNIGGRPKGSKDKKPRKQRGNNKTHKIEKTKVEKVDEEEINDGKF